MTLTERSSRRSRTARIRSYRRTRSSGYFVFWRSPTTSALF
jgi:hypothetical protein